MGILSDLSEITSLVKATAVGPLPGTEQVRANNGSMLADPYLWTFAGENYREKPSPVSYSLLRFLCRRDMLLATIMLTRLRQVSAFAQVRTREEVSRSVGTGFRVSLKEGTGAKTEKVLAYEDTLNAFMMKCGRPDIEPVEHDFASWLWKFCRDRMEIDQAATEIRYDKKGKIAEFFAVDGATIRLTDPTRNRKELFNKQFVQLYMNRVVTTYSREEMMFCPENISSDIGSNGYGLAETEVAMRQVMTHLGIEETNARVFAPGSMPKGLLTLENADISEEQLQILEAKYRSQVATFRGKHKLPLLPLPRGGKLTFVHFPQATDLEFGHFIDYLVNICTALFGMDPSEINFPNRAGGIGSAPGLVSSSPEALRLTASKDKGLRTLLAFVERSINNHIVPMLDDTGDFEFSFQGFDARTDQERSTLDQTAVRTWKTVNEVRRDHGQEDLEHGDILLDSIYLQAVQQAQMAQGQEGLDMEGAGGDTDDEEYASWKQGSTGNPDEDEGDLW